MSDGHEGDLSDYSGPFCRHWSECGCCEHLCGGCGHSCNVHLDECGGEGCGCKGWSDGTVAPP